MENAYNKRVTRASSILNLLGTVKIVSNINAITKHPGGRKKTETALEINIIAS
jgi:hypothetical protein